MKILLILFPLLISACAIQPAKEQGIPSSDIESFLEAGFEQLSNRNPKKAIAAFDEAVSRCENQYSSNKSKVYASRGPEETLYYMVLAVANKESAIAVGPNCADALYFRGYASLDLGQLNLAEQYINRAIDMAPVNSNYLSELGHIYHSKRDWEQALEIFKRSEHAAINYSPPDFQNMELARAKRGVGYSLIELGKLSEAEEKFKECLKIDKDDKGALRELKYIEQIRNDKNNPKQSENPSQ